MRTSTDPTESAATGLRCIRCGATFELAPMFQGCPQCAGPEDLANVAVTYDYEVAGRTFRLDALARRRRQGIWRWAELLPIGDPAARVTLGEGDTPLVLVQDVDGGEVWVKDESRNPTWSYKDRLCAAAVSHGVATGARVFTASSTGNHGAAAAAYAARARRPCVIFTRPEVPDTMKVLMQMYGARVLATTRLGRWALVAAGVERAAWYPLSSFTMPPTGNPYGLEGYKTIAFELVETMGRAPGTVVVPTGYGEGLSGTWRGFEDLRRLGVIHNGPRMIAAETATAGPLARALALGADAPVRVETKPSVAFSINSMIATLQSLHALRESGGTSIQVNDEEILAAQTRLGRAGLFAEATSAAALAAVDRARRDHIELPPPVVVIMTSSGLKDPRTPGTRLPAVSEVAPDWNAVMPALDPALL